jgi:hypothetical protein
MVASAPPTDALALLCARQSRGKQVGSEGMAVFRSHQGNIFSLMAVIPYTESKELSFSDDTREVRCTA